MSGPTEPLIVDDGLVLSQQILRAMNARRASHGDRGVARRKSRRHRSSPQPKLVSESTSLGAGAVRRGQSIACRTVVELNHRKTSKKCQRNEERGWVSGRASETIRHESVLRA